MNKLTRNGIAHDLTYSPYGQSVLYSDDLALNFIFSSEYNKTRFMEKLNQNREYINTSLSKRFNITVTADVLCDIKLYTMIEKRGFYIIKNNSEEYKCQDSLELTGVTLTYKKQSE